MTSSQKYGLATPLRKTQLWPLINSSNSSRTTNVITLVSQHNVTGANYGIIILTHNSLGTHTHTHMHRVIIYELLYEIKSLIIL